MALPLRPNLLSLPFLCRGTLLHSKARRAACNSVSKPFSSVVEKQMKRVCCFMAFHCSTFVPAKCCTQDLELDRGFSTWRSGIEGAARREGYGSLLRICDEILTVARWRSESAPQSQYLRIFAFSPLLQNTLTISAEQTRPGRTNTRRRR